MPDTLEDETVYLRPVTFCCGKGKSTVVAERDDGVTVYWYLEWEEWQDFLFKQGEQVLGITNICEEEFIQATLTSLGVHVVGAKEGEKIKAWVISWDELWELCCAHGSPHGSPKTTSLLN